MSKIFGVLLIVLGVWLGLEIYTKGMDGAFGGALARLTAPIGASRDAAAPHDSLGQRVGAKVQGELDDAARRETNTGDEEDND
jgi:hypothetical protein